MKLNLEISKIQVTRGRGPDRVSLTVDNADNPLPGTEGHKLYFDFQVQANTAEEYLNRNFSIAKNDIEVFSL